MLISPFILLKAVQQLVKLFCFEPSFDYIAKNNAIIKEQENQLKERDTQLKEQENQLKERGTQLKERDTQLQTSIKMLLRAGLSPETIANQLGVNLQMVKDFLSSDGD